MLLSPLYKKGKPNFNFYDVTKISKLRNDLSLTRFINHKVIIVSKALVVLGPVIHP